MSRLIITGTNYETKNRNSMSDYSFIVYNLEKKQLEFEKPKIAELESDISAIQGRPQFRPFGISSQDERIVISSNDRFAVFDKNTFELISTLKIPAFVNTHQIILDGDYLFVCNTANDSIGIHNLKTGESKYLKVFPEIELVDSVITPEDAYELDNTHLNSLFKKGDLLYFCLHRRGKKPSSFGYFNLKTEKGELLFDAGLRVHDVQILGNKLYSLSSDTGDLIQTDLDTLKPLYYRIVDKETTFLRGMETYNNKLLIACSNRTDINTKFAMDEYGNKNVVQSHITSHLRICDPEKNTIDPFIDIPEIDFILDIHLI